MRWPLAIGFVALFLGVSLLQQPFAVEAQTQPQGRRLAFLVGVKAYDHSQLKNLDYPERDVEEFGDALRKAGFTVVVLTTERGAKDADLMPTVASIGTQLHKLVARVTKHDTILVGLAGHGIQPLGSDLAYFCPKDANPTIVAGVGNQPSTVKFGQTLLSIDSLLATLDDSGIGHKLLLMDACRNDPGVRGRRGIDKVKVSALPRETAVLLSCSPGQFAFEHKSWGGGHGAFFHHVIEGIQGAAVDTDEGGVTWDSLVKYVGKRVPQSVASIYGKDGGEQRPNRIVNLSADTILLAKLAPARPVTPIRQSVDLESVTRPMLTRQEPGIGSKPADAKTITSAATGMKLVLIPSGEYLRGSPASDKGAMSEEKPQHRVRIAQDFYLGMNEVTQEEWKAVMGTEPWTGKDYVREGKDYPATYVSWTDADEFCRKLSQKDGRTYRLPTEAEWEYAARGGTTTKYSFGDDESKLSDYAWWGGIVGDGNTRIEPHAHQVGLKKANPFGLFDMHGNVWEWCSDWYDEKEYMKHVGRTAHDPEGPQSGSDRVVRGGSWDHGPQLVRSANRYRHMPVLRFSFLGFRVASIPSIK